METRAKGHIRERPHVVRPFILRRDSQQMLEVIMPSVGADPAGRSRRTVLRENTLRDWLLICALCLSWVLVPTGDVPSAQATSPSNSAELSHVSDQLSPTATSYGYGWRQSGTRWWYADGSSYFTGWHKINGYWYYFDAYGWKFTSWLSWKSAWYYLYALGDYGSTWEGKMAQYGWEKIRGSWFYFRPADNNIAPGDEGAILESGYWSIGGKDYWFNDNGNYFERNNFRLGDSTTTAQRNSIARQYTYYSQGTYFANCLSFALDKVPTYNTWSDWSWPWQGNVNTIQVMEYLRPRGFKTYTMNTSVRPRVAVYGHSTSNITHFARVNTSGAIRAKWGRSEIFSHTTTSPYNVNGDYGALLFYVY